MTGLGPLPQALYNGESFHREELNFKELEMAVLHRMMDTTAYLQKEVFMVGKHVWENVWWVIFINYFCITLELS